MFSFLTELQLVTMWAFIFCQRFLTRSWTVSTSKQWKLNILWFQSKSNPIPRSVIGNYKGKGVSKANNYKEKYELTLYSLRRTTVFLKLANEDTLPVYNIPFDISFEGALKEVAILREIALKCKNEWLKKMYRPSTILGILLNYSLSSSS